MATRKDATVQQLVDEHLHLHKILETVRQMLRERRATPEVVVATLRELIQHVLDHFEHEEAGGYFAAAMEAAPLLRERAHELLLEHAEMAEQLLALQLCAVREKRLNYCWQELAEGFEAFLDTFATHEAAEQALLQEAYGDEIGAED